MRYVFYGLFSSNPKQIPKPSRPLKSVLPDIGLETYEFLGSTVDLDKYFTNENVEAPELPGEERPEGDPGDPPSRPDDVDLPEYAEWLILYELKMIYEAWLIYDSWESDAEIPEHFGEEPEGAKGDPDYDDWYEEQMAYKIYLYHAYNDALDVRLGDMIELIVFNSSRIRKYKKETKEYNKAKFDAMDNQMQETRARMKGEGRRRAEGKKIEKKMINKTTGRNKSMQKRFVAKLASQWRANNKSSIRRQQAVSRARRKQG